jgi:ectoine hydroxylase-related dioxygenase (phytanoyl-CoA dioxygenase family)
MNLEQFNEQGFFVEENVLSSDYCDQLIEESRTLENYIKGTYSPQMMPHRMNRTYLEALRHPKIVASITEIVGGEAVGLQTEFFYCKPGTQGFGKHQDNFFVEAAPEKFASAWCALTDVTVENGALIAWPGTHKEGLLPVRKVTVEKDSGQDPNANNEECVIPPQYMPINLHVSKGSVCYIHSHLVHASNSNKTQDRWRQVLLCTYIRKGEKFRPGRYAQRKAVEV